MEGATPNASFSSKSATPAAVVRGSFKFRFAGLAVKPKTTFVTVATLWFSFSVKVPLRSKNCCPASPAVKVKVLLGGKHSWLIELERRLAALQT